jgi:hypothetical protein
LQGFLPALVGALNDTLFLEGKESLTEALIFDGTEHAELGTVVDLGIGEGGEDIVAELGVGTFSWRGQITDHFEVDGIFRLCDETEGNGLGGLGGAVFKGKEELFAVPAEEEVGIAPSPAVNGTAEGAAVLGAGDVFPGVVDEEDGGVEATLEVAEEGQEGSHFAGVVFVGGVEADKGVEEDEARAELFDGGFQAQAVGRAVQTEGRFGDGVEGKVREGDVPGASHGFHSGAHGGKGIFGEEEEDGALGRDGESAEAGGGGSHREGHVEAEP